MAKQFLFIGERSDQQWIELLEGASEPYGKLVVTPMSELDSVKWPKFKIAFLDAMGSGEIADTIISLHKHNKKMHVVVVTYSPTWSRTLEAKNAGASGYINKFISKRELGEKIGEIIQTPVPSVQPKRTVERMHA